MLSLYDYNSYKEFLKDLIASKSVRGFLSALAQNAGCTHSYLSQVIHGKPQITPDQAIGISEFLNQTDDECEFFLHLVLLERAATDRLRKILKKKLEALREKRISITAAIKSTSDESLKNEYRDFYYAKWTVPAIHMLTACPEYQTPEAISKRLSIPVIEVESILGWLVSTMLVKKSGRNHRHSGKNVHLPTESIHNSLNHLNWRMKAVQSAGSKSDIHYTSIFAISRKDWDKLKTELLQFLEHQRIKIGNSGSEEGYVFCCDLFRA